MTITSLLQNATRDAELLLAHVLKQSREYLLSHGEKRVTITQVRRFHVLHKRLLNGEPLAYILGTAPFCHLEFKVNQNVLIPRPETELLVEKAAVFLKNQVGYTIVDVGTGSGCIVITLATLQRKHTYHAIDISTKALTVAKQNARTHGVTNIHFHKGNLLDPLKKIRGPLLILANLPYGTARDIKRMRTHEPPSAIDGGKNGLDIYKRLFVQLQSMKTPWALIAEIDPRQEKTLRTILPQYFPARTATITKDWNNRSRVLTIE